MSVGIVNRRRSALRGFTLVELAVTLAVLAVLSVVAFPGMLGLIRDAQLSTSTDLLVNALNTARVEAVKRRGNMTVCPAADPNADTACSTSALDWSKGLIVMDAASVVLLRIPFKAGLTVSTATTSVVFSGTLGGSVAAAFTLCSSGRAQQQVDVSASGHVSKKINTTTCT